MRFLEAKAIVSAISRGQVDHKIHFFGPPFFDPFWLFAPLGVAPYDLPNFAKNAYFCRMEKIGRS